MTYPRVLSEDETLDLVLSGKSIARYGDGELRLAKGGAAISQAADRRLMNELLQILRSTDERLVVGIPNVDAPGPKRNNWLDYARPTYLRMLDLRKVYGSAFISRPDSAPWIHRPDYWEKVKRLWEGRDVILVTGEPDDSDKIKRIGVGARSVHKIIGPRRNAWEKVDSLEQEIGKPSIPVLLALGATATVLAARLSRKGVHAIDIGHVGMFMTRYQI